MSGRTFLYKTLTDDEIAELRQYFSSEYHEEIERILESRVVGGYDDLMFNALSALHELEQRRKGELA